MAARAVDRHVPRGWLPVGLWRQRGWRAAFTRGIEYLQQIIADKTAAGRAAPQVEPLNNPACGFHRMLTENSVIADLGKASRNARGMIEYETDFFILRPAELQRFPPARMP